MSKEIVLPPMEDLPIVGILVLTLGLVIRVSDFVLET